MRTVDDTILRKLDRHAQRREQCVPTVSVLLGPPARSVAYWRHWARKASRPPLFSSNPDSASLFDDWFEFTCAQRDTTEDVARFLAARIDRSSHDLRHIISRQTGAETEVLFQRAFQGESGTPVARLCRALLNEAPGTLSPDDIRTCFPGDAHPLHRFVEASTALFPENTLPALMLAEPSRTPKAPDWLEQSACVLSGIATECPALPVALAVHHEVFAAYLAQTPDTRTKALCRETVIIIPEFQAETGADTGEAPDNSLPADAITTLQYLREDAAPQEVIAAYRRAAAQFPVLEPITREGDSRARSAAERFLFLRLESLPETAGLFTLNQRLPIPFGRAPHMEVDLVAPRPHLAIEIDGYYHFEDADAYRRDRRKDLALQKEDFVVLRFLAEDVVVRLETILETILDALAFQQKRPTPAGRHTALAMRGEPAGLREKCHDRPVQRDHSR